MVTFPSSHGHFAVARMDTMSVQRTTMVVGQRPIMTRVCLAIYRRQLICTRNINGVIATNISYAANDPLPISLAPRKTQSQMSASHRLTSMSGLGSVTFNYLRS